MSALIICGLSTVKIMDKFKYLYIFFYFFILPNLIQTNNLTFQKQSCTFSTFTFSIHVFSN